jgi:hypothetical protein
VTVPDRVLVLVTAANVALAVPAAVPLVGDTLIQVESLTDAVHEPPAHPLGLALTVNVAEPPVGGIVRVEVGLTENVQVGGVAPVSLTVMFCPAMVTVPDRVLVLVFVANVALAVPAALPLVGDTLIQVESLTDAVHEPPLHPLGLALTVNVAEPPLAGIESAEVGLAENVQVGVTPSSVTAMVCPAIVTVPDRVLVLVFAANVAPAVPAAVPLVGDTLIQVESLTDADHEPPLHPLGLALTVNVAEPPLAGIVDTEVGLAEKVQMGADAA